MPPHEAASVAAGTSTAPSSTRLESSESSSESSSSLAIERLGDAIIEAIKSGGAELPIVKIEHDPNDTNACASDLESASSLSSPSVHQQGSVEWTEYAPSAGGYASARANAVISELRRSVEAVHKRFPNLDISTAVSPRGRPLLYSACLGLGLSPRGNIQQTETNNCSPLDVFLAVLYYLLSEVHCPPDQPTFAVGACHRPPIHLLARSCHPEAVSVLLAAGVDPTDTDDEGWTALMATCMPAGPPGSKEERAGPTMEERLETARLLLGNDGDGIDKNNYQGYTALHMACDQMLAPLVRLLLENGANPTLRTWIGESPLGMISWRESQDPTSAGLCRQYLLDSVNALEAKEKVSDNSQAKSSISGYRIFMEEEQKVVALIKLVDRVLIPLANKEARNAARRDRLLLMKIMETVGMDHQSILGTKLTSNWYETLHERISELVPRAFRKIYRNEYPTEDEYDLITSHDGHAKDAAMCFIPADKDAPEKGGPRRLDVNVLRRAALIPNRQRGLCARNMDNITRILVNPLKYTVAFAVPSNAVIDRLATIAPKIVEMGAGTGYWSAVLRLRGIDVVAYDASPPSGDGAGGASGNAENAFFSNDFAYTRILKGEGDVIFQGDEGKDLAKDRALLMVWPNNADHIDNPHVHVSSTKPPPVWDADCLSAYLAAGGETVIYVGEREEKIELDDEATGPDCGYCSSRRFQTMLKDNFMLQEEMACPGWDMDDLTVWVRRS